MLLYCTNKILSNRCLLYIIACSSSLICYYIIVSSKIRLFKKWIPNTSWSLRLITIYNNVLASRFKIICILNIGGRRFFSSKRFEHVQTYRLNRNALKNEISHVAQQVLRFVIAVITVNLQRQLIGVYNILKYQGSWISSCIRVILHTETVTVTTFKSTQKSS